MAKTPPHLRVFGIQEQCGRRKVSRAFLAFRDRKKRKEFLSLAWCMQMAGAVEQHGSPSSQVEARSQAMMASMLGIDRSTFNRRLQQFSDPDGRWDEARRLRLSRTMRAIAEKEGKKIRPGRAVRSVQRVASLFNKNAQFGQVQLYSWRMPESKKPGLEKKESKTQDAALLAEAFGEQYFDPECPAVNGFKPVDGWIWDPRLPDVEKCGCQQGQLCLLPGQTCPKCDGSGAVYPRDSRGERVPMADYGRVLMTYLLLKGLQQYGSVEITQDKMANDLGYDVNTIAKYEDKWELLTIIRCIPGKVTRECIRCSKNFVDKCSCGATFGPVVHRDPHKIVWLPDRLMDEDLAQKEWSRFYALQDQVQARAFTRAAEIHAELLKAWRGKEHSLQAFWNEMRRRLASADLHTNVVDTLFPFYRE